MKRGLQWIAPFRPLRTGIANYTADLFDAVDGRWPIGVVVEEGSALPGYQTIRSLPVSQLRKNQPTIATLGNSEFHDIGFDLADAGGSLVVLHDVHLHHARAAMAVRRGATRQYWRDLDTEYGAAGVEAGRALLNGSEVSNFDEFPMFESIVRGARATIVHSEYAAAQIRSRVPEADVRVIPMGIPMPATVSRSEARRMLGIRGEVFVIASITHVNPNKRLPTVLRAIRRLAARQPAILFLIAGTGSDSDALRNEISILGLQQVVKTFGYVDDRTARLIASASDACVNLRFPTAGETSASLLRLLGTGRPVLVSDAGTSAEIPDGVAVKVPVDHLETDMIAHTLAALATQPQLCEDLKIASREYVQDQHSMASMVNGYREVIENAYGLVLPRLEGPPIAERPIASHQGAEVQGRPTATSMLAASILELGLQDSDIAFEASGRAVAELRLGRRPRTVRKVPSDRLLRRVACPKCQAPVRSDRMCSGCGHRVPQQRAVLDVR